MRRDFAWVWRGLILVTAALCLVSEPVSAQNPLDSVTVVPNPWNVSGRTLGPEGGTVWTNIRFVRLPDAVPGTPTKIRIYTPACNLVAELENNDDTGTTTWKGRNNDNEYVVSGVYIYVVEHPLYGVKSGKLIIIR